MSDKNKCKPNIAHFINDFPHDASAEQIEAIVESADILWVQLNKNLSKRPDFDRGREVQQLTDLFNKLSFERIKTKKEFRFISVVSGLSNLACSAVEIKRIQECGGNVVDRSDQVLPLFNRGHRNARGLNF